MFHLKKSAVNDGNFDSDSNMFESVSALDQLDLGIIDGDAFADEKSDSHASSESSVQTVTVVVSLRSIQNDLKIKFTDENTGLLIIGVPFEVNINGGGETKTISDTDMDGMIYLSGLAAGDYTVSLNDITNENKTYQEKAEAKIAVSDKIEYAKVDVKDEIKTEAQVNVAAEDTKVQDEDETTVASDKSDASTTASSQAYEDDISEEAEDILDQIEQENNSNNQNNNNTPSDNTPDITTTPEYIAAHEGTKGIDVSKHNGAIDWNAVKNAGIDFAIIRCGYRGSSSGALIVDPMFETNINGARNAGLSVGVYFYSQAVNETEAVEEASMVLDLVSNYSLQYPIYIDVEKSNGRGDAISIDERTAVCQAFLSTISSAGYSGGVYSNKKWFEGMIHTSSLTNYSIWMAQYVDIPSYTATKYNIWQYSSKGQIPGISGNVDLNVLK